VEDNRKLSMLYTMMLKQEEEELVKTSLLASNLQGRFSKRMKVVLSCTFKFERFSHNYLYIDLAF